MRHFSHIGESATETPFHRPPQLRSPRKFRVLFLASKLGQPWVRSKRGASHCHAVDGRTLELCDGQLAVATASANEPLPGSAGAQRRAKALDGSQVGETAPPHETRIHDSAPARAACDTVRRANITPKPPASQHMNNGGCGDVTVFPGALGSGRSYRRNGLCFTFPLISDSHGATALGANRCAHKGSGRKGLFFFLSYHEYQP